MSRAWREKDAGPRETDGAPALGPPVPQSHRAAGKRAGDGRGTGRDRARPLQPSPGETACRGGALSPPVFPGAPCFRGTGRDRARPLQPSLGRTSRRGGALSPPALPGSPCFRGTGRDKARPLRTVCRRAPGGRTGPCPENNGGGPVTGPPPLCMFVLNRGTPSRCRSRLGGRRKRRRSRHGYYYFPS